jgi:hypothetical protein
MSMRWSPWLSILCCTVLLAFNTGCLFTRHTTNVVRKNEKPRAVAFESPQAKNIFDGKLVEAKTNLNTNFSNPRVVAVPFLLWYSSTDVVSDNGIYNDQLAICDINGDGVVTLDEASTYAAKVDEQIAKREAEKAKNNAQFANNAPTGTNSTSAPAYAQPPTYPTQPASAQQPLEARQPQAPLPPNGYR